MSRVTSTSALVRQSLQLGLAIVLPLLILLGVGRWLDVRYGKSPLFLLIGLGISLVITGWFLMRIVKDSKQ